MRYGKVHNTSGTAHTLNAEQLAKVLGISRGNAYNLMHAKGFPTLKIGKRMVVQKDKLIQWMEHQTEAC